jgi:hypothetical protein
MGGCAEPSGCATESHDNQIGAAVPGEFDGREALEALAKESDDLV